MKTIEFVKKYKELTAEENIVRLIQNRIKTNYVSYINKINICNNIVNSTSKTKTDDGLYRFKDNSPLRRMFYDLNIINLYTDIEIDFNNAAFEYDLLEEYDLIDIVISAINQSEVKKFDEVLNMIITDMYNNERSVVSYNESKDIKKFKLINDIIGSVVDIIDNNSIIKNKIEEIIENVSNEID